MTILIIGTFGQYGLPWDDVQVIRDRILDIFLPINKVILHDSTVRNIIILSA